MRLQWAMATLAVMLLAIQGYILLKSPSRQVTVVPESSVNRGEQTPPPAERPKAAPKAGRSYDPPVDPDDRATPAEVEEVGEALRKTLEAFRLKAPAVRKSGEAWTASISRDLNIHRLTFALIEQLDKVDGKIIHTVEDRRRGRLEYTVTVDGDWACRIVLLRRETIAAVTGKIALVIDDFGYAYNDLARKFIFYPKPLTLAILPGQKATSAVARDARLAGREVLVHMPMEPLDEKFSDEGYTLLSGQDAGTIRLRVRAALAQIPQALGINNHQGSRVTADRAMMKVVMAELKRQNKLFIDSRTSAASVALKVAREQGVRAAANQLFIDAEDDTDFITAQMNKAAKLAGEQGEVIAIAHMRKRTLKVLERMIPDLEQQGIRFVYLSEVM